MGHQKDKKSEHEDMIFTGLTEKEAFVLRKRFGISLTPSHKQATETDPFNLLKLTCSICGKPSNHVERVFDGKHYVVICQSCQACDADA